MGLSDKRCDQCGKQPATVRYTEVDDGRVTKRLLCAACAQARGLMDEPPPPAPMLHQVLAVAPAPPPKSSAAAADPAGLVCRACGLSFAAFRRQGRLGCDACYAAFESQLVPLLRQIHAHVKHTGKAPRACAREAELRQRAEDLRRELERAVRAEDYERAAQLRDEIRTVEQQQSGVARESGATPEPGAGR